MIPKRTAPRVAVPMNSGDTIESSPLVLGWDNDRECWTVVETRHRRGPQEICSLSVEQEQPDPAGLVALVRRTEAGDRWELVRWTRNTPPGWLFLPLEVRPLVELAPWWALPETWPHREAAISAAMVGSPLEGRSGGHLRALVLVSLSRRSYGGRLPITVVVRLYEAGAMVWIALVSVSDEDTEPVARTIEAFAPLNVTR